MGRISVNTSKRFWQHVEIKDDNSCWYWKGAKDVAGYGKFRLGSNAGAKQVYAHRYALLGDLIETREGVVCHTCDHSSCCNPAHLYLGTHTDNVCDRMNRNSNVGRIRRKLHSGEIWLSLIHI